MLQEDLYTYKNIDVKIDCVHCTTCRLGGILGGKFIINNFHYDLTVVIDILYGLVIYEQHAL